MMLEMLQMLECLPEMTYGTAATMNSRASLT